MSRPVSPFICKLGSFQSWERRVEVRQNFNCYRNKKNKQKSTLIIRDSWILVKNLPHGLLEAKASSPVIMIKEYILEYLYNATAKINQHIGLNEHNSYIVRQGDNKTHIHLFMRK